MRELFLSSKNHMQLGDSRLASSLLKTLQNFSYLTSSFSNSLYLGPDSSFSIPPKVSPNTEPTYSLIILKTVISSSSISFLTEGNCKIWEFQIFSNYIVSLFSVLGRTLVKVIWMLKSKHRNIMISFVVEYEVQ